MKKGSGLTKGGDVHFEGPEYFKVLKASLEGIERKSDDAFKYVLRLAWSGVTTGAVNEPTIDFLGAGGAGTFIPLPFKRMIMRKRRSVVRWRSVGAVANGYVDHEMLFRTPVPMLTVQTNFSITLSTPVNWNPDPAATPIGETYWFQSAMDSDFKETPAYILGPGGFSCRFALLQSAPVNSAPTPVNLIVGDAVLINFELEFDVLPE